MREVVDQPWGQGRATGQGHGGMNAKELVLSRAPLWLTPVGLQNQLPSLGKATAFGSLLCSHGVSKSHYPDHIHIFRSRASRRPHQKGQGDVFQAIINPPKEHNTPQDRKNKK